MLPKRDVCSEVPVDPAAPAVSPGTQQPLTPLSRLARLFACRLLARPTLLYLDCPRVLLPRLQRSGALRCGCFQHHAPSLLKCQPLCKSSTTRVCEELLPRQVQAEHARQLVHADVRGVLRCAPQGESQNASAVNAHEAVPAHARLAGRDLRPLGAPGSHAVRGLCGARPPIGREEGVLHHGVKVPRVGVLDHVVELLHVDVVGQVEAAVLHPQ
mmetsp:Transcript_83105/g.243654  ORF Transcript_83105/g.243654 Transcript_83105/m.243654 type:complete len:214 (-) Transcript_83105:399-1040(-)